MRTLSLLLVLVVALTPGLSGGFDKLPVSARAVTFGGSLAAVMDDPNALFVNPAAIARLNGVSLSTSYTQLFTGITDDQLSYLSGAATLNLSPLGVAGVGLKSFQSTAWKEGMVVGSFSHEFFEYFTLGASAKFLYWRSAPPSGRLAIPEDGMSASALAFDVGGQTIVPNIFPDNDIIVGVSLQNLNRPSMAATSGANQSLKDAARLDMGATLGVSYVSRALEYIVSASYQRTQSVNRIAFGVEIVAAHTQLAGQEAAFIVRGGGGTSTRPARQGDLAGGFGLIVAGVGLDYAFGQPTQLDYLSGTHHITLRYSF